MPVGADQGASAFYSIQLQHLAPRGHKPIRQEGKGQPSCRLVLCLSGLIKALPLFIQSSSST
ncbi:hypothetical protein D3H55_11790 [Bacillus salacetis]|uniref:Uncharacterized protein n=1 Tax=Bacillus salacetis TaxID=2315464 RepID=A0A3A1R2B8_9BACI|nr:hypothetical protein D3H55_11790 [Bacillus salacetis]